MNLLSLASLAIVREPVERPTDAKVKAGEETVFTSTTYLSSHSNYEQAFPEVQAFFKMSYLHGSQIFYTLGLF